MTLAIAVILEAVLATVLLPALDLYLVITMALSTEMIK